MLCASSGTSKSHPPPPPPPPLLSVSTGLGTHQGAKPACGRLTASEEGSGCLGRRGSFACEMWQAKLAATFSVLLLIFLAAGVGHNGTSNNTSSHRSNRRSDNIYIYWHKNSRSFRGRFFALAFTTLAETFGGMQDPYLLRAFPLLLCIRIYVRSHDRCNQTRYAYF